MKLSPMRFKDYVWPHNPRVYEISFGRRVVSHKVPMGGYALQSLGRTYRILKGEGEFVGPGAYDEFRKLGTVFYEDTPGILVHPIWQESRAWFVSLRLRQEPAEDYVRYSFEFWECFEGDSAFSRLRLLSEIGSGRAETGDAVYTVDYGDTLWSIARDHGLSLETLLERNPQIKNPNLVQPGDTIRLTGKAG